MNAATRAATRAAEIERAGQAGLTAVRSVMMGERAGPIVEPFGQLLRGGETPAAQQFGDAKKAVGAAGHGWAVAKAGAMIGITADDSAGRARRPAATQPSFGACRPTRLPSVSMKKPI